MSAHSMEMLKGGLREIRDAAGNLRGQKWSAASELDRVLRAQAKQVAKIYELPLVDRGLKSSFSVICFDWAAAYRQAIEQPARLELQELVFGITERLISRIDTLQNSLQADE